ncbi:hypothetical protein MK805_04120 [Shimazuella sp. AN120528]|uniref:hypothetical protein n=1 Tax=Shimazuella soli TaxID=1892854 RepID=UPI001F0D578E|nr:hypothetical protein [Shimazuella soli]MCH5584152.1 hypothetical protein [Shimazuella soli]
MACTNTNILANGGFRQGLAPWTGINIKRVANPVYKGDASVLLQNGSVLKQKQPITIQKGCAYYFYFRLLNATTGGRTANLFATVVYLDRNGKILRSTPLQILLPKASKLAFKPYFDIVPPPPSATRSVAVSFSGVKGKIFVDYIRLAAHTV